MRAWIGECLVMLLMIEKICFLIELLATNETFEFRIVVNPRVIFKRMFRGEVEGTLFTRISDFSPMHHLLMFFQIASLRDKHVANIALIVFASLMHTFL